MGALDGLKVVEFAGIGPGPHCGMLLADMGADVLVIDRPGGYPSFPIVSRGKTNVVLDLKGEEGRRVAADASAVADVLIEGFRPGVMERLGLGPELLLARNPALIYGRITGWGQHGPLAHSAGHDINYIALTGALDPLGFDDRPAPPPLNLVGDFGGGSMFLAFGILAALIERQMSGLGQVVDAAIIDGTASLLASAQGCSNTGQMPLQRGYTTLAGNAPHYRCYACADGREVAVGALELRFRAELLRHLGLAELDWTDDDEASVAHATTAISACFATRPRDQWCALFDGTDCCVIPVLTLSEAIAHPHNVARTMYVQDETGVAPAPAPRLSRTPGRVRSKSAMTGQDRLTSWGVQL